MIVRMPSWFTDRAERVLIAVLGALFVAFAFTMMLAKFSGLGYNALDLAIFLQTIAQSAHGHLFGLTIHPHLYLGDHVSPFLLLFVPFFRALPRPETLLALQAVAVGLSVWPLAALATQILPRGWRLLVVAIFVLNPLVHNLLMFEFESTAFALPLLFAAILAYHRRRCWWYLFALFAALTVREDLGLVLFGFGLLAAVDRRSFPWWLWPMLLGTAGFFGGMYLSGTINHEHYKFLAYYGWLGATAGEAARAVLLRPWTLLFQILRLQNILFVLLLLLLTGGIALLRLRRTIPMLPVLAALLLTSFGGSAITLRTHYPALLLPFLFWSLIEGIDRLRAAPPAWARRLFEGAAPRIAALILAAVALYGTFTMGPFRPFGVRAVLDARSDPRTLAARALAQEIPADARLAASFSELPLFGNLPELYSLHYAFSGRRQLSKTPYTIPESANWVFFDSNDVQFYNIQFGADKEQNQSGDDRLRSLVARPGFSLAEAIDSFLLFRRDGRPLVLPYEIGLTRGIPVENNGDPVRLIAVDGQSGGKLQPAVVTIGNRSIETLPIDLTWSVIKKTDNNYRLVVEYVDERGIVRASRTSPLGFGLWPTSEWSVGTPVLHHFNWILPLLPAGTYTVRVRAETIEGFLTLDPKLSAEIALTKRTPAGPPAVLGLLRR